MRHLIAAALVLSPVMVTAQTATSAQNPQAAVMQSSVAAPNQLMLSSASAAPAADRTQAVTTHPRVSTGVVEPKLIHTVTIHQETLGVMSLSRNFRSAAVSMVVDAEGKPTDVKIMKSAGADMDPNILEAVSQYRFEPATVSGQKVAMTLNLHLDIQMSRE
jgi:TonB family protein